MKTFSQIVKTSFRSFAANGMIAALALCGVLALCCFAPQDASDWAKVRKLVALDAAAFGATSPHSSVLVVGVLDGNPTRTTNGSVVYVEQRRDTPDDGGDRYPPIVAGDAAQQASHGTFLRVISVSRVRFPSCGPSTGTTRCMALAVTLAGRFESKANHESA